MIAKIKGTIDELKPTEVILDANGVGYGLTIPLSTYEKIQALNETTLFVYTHHKEDQLKLFGFFTENERDLFTLLLNISGIGPAMAIAILSGITVGRLVDAVQSENISLLTKIPGIGNAKAEKLIFELKRKLKKIASIAGEPREPRTQKTDAIEALVILGFDDARSSKIVDELVKKNPDSSVEAIIKEALKLLSA
jgi:Holliday junction DNA helicase RuvA